MEIIYKGNAELLEQQLRNPKVVQQLIFDLALNIESEVILESLDAEKYRLSYSRPLFFNPVKLQSFDYEYVFLVERHSDYAIVRGKVRLKGFVVVALLLLLLIVGYHALTYLFERSIFFWLFHAGLPVMLVAYLLMEYFVFRKRVQRFFVDINR